MSAEGNKSMKIIQKGMQKILIWKVQPKISWQYYRWIWTVASACWVVSFVTFSVHVYFFFNAISLLDFHKLKHLPDQDWQNIGPGLDQNPLTLLVSWKEFF